MISENGVNHINFIAVDVGNASEKPLFFLFVRRMRKK